jgi:pilus assembly protein Flp/PilA
MLKVTIDRLRALLRDESGQDVIEYALLATLIAVVAIGVLSDAGTQVGTLWDNIAAGIAVVP